MKDLELIKRALEKGNNKGSYTLEEAAVIFNGVQSLGNEIKKLQEKVEELANREKNLKKQVKK